MIESLSNDENKSFIWAEVAFLDMWWNDQDEERRNQLRKYVNNIKFAIIVRY